MSTLGGGGGGGVGVMCCCRRSVGVGVEGGVAGVFVSGVGVGVITGDPS